MAEKQSDKRTLEILEISTIMSTSSGRNVMNRILRSTGVDTTTFDRDERIHVYNEGRRSIGIELRAELMNAAPGEYMMMIKENLNA